MSDFVSKREYDNLLKKVIDLEDTIIKLKRNLKDDLENLDIDNFSESFKVKQDKASLEIKQTAKELSVKMEDYDTSMIKMQSEIRQTASAIETKVSKENLKESLKEYSTTLQTATLIKTTVSHGYVTDLIKGEYATVSSVSEISQKADDISISVTETQGNLSDLEGKINLQSDEIIAIISGNYTGDMLNNYLTGIKITPENIKMITSQNTYSTFASDGLRFYDSDKQVEGWAIEPNLDDGYGGLLKYYVNNKPHYSFGRSSMKNSQTCTDRGYAYTDMTLKMHESDMGKTAGGFVVDVTESANPKIKFVGMSLYGDHEDSPDIYANGMLLATQDWVLANAGGGGAGTVVAVFG